MEQPIIHTERGPLPIVKIVITLAATLVGFQIVGPLIGFFIAVPVYPGTLMEMVEALKNPQEEAIKVPYFIIQGFGTLFGLVVLPWLLLRIWGEDLKQYFPRNITVQAIVIIVFLAFSSIIVISVFGAWNQAIEFPEFLSGFEKWARSMEEQLGVVSKFLTTFTTPFQFFLAFIVVAILPGIGEELVFRGLLQNQFQKLTGNIHVAIWVSAILFSAIHLQFFGFVPRLLLGALFGYIYYWSGNLFLAMFAHFLNNALAIIGVYMYQKGAMPIDPESPEPASWPAVAAAAVIATALLYYFKKLYTDPHKPIA